MSKSKRTLKEDYLLIKRGIAIVSQSTPHYLFHIIFFSFCYQTAFVSAAYITAAIVDELTGERNIKKLIFLVCCYFAEIIFRILRDYSWRQIRSLNIISDEWEDMLLNEKNFSMDYKNMENAEIRAKRQTLTGNSFSGLPILTQRLISLFQSFWRIVLYSAISLEMFFKHSDKVLSGFSKVIDSPLTTLIFFVLIGLLAFADFKINHKYNHRIAANEQSCSFINRNLRYYLDDYLDDGKVGKDIHIFSQKRLIEHSSDIFYGDWKKVIDEKFKNLKIKCVWHNAFYTVMSALSYLYVVLKIYIGSFTLGGLLKYHACISGITSSLSLLSVAISELRANNDHMGLLFEYLDIPTDMHYGTIPTEKRSDNVYDIEFHNVSFKYPGTDTYAIKNMSFKFKVGERIAVVGMNGSGKTTMIKLLCRLYDPTEGYITLNGIDIQKYDYEDYLAIFSVVFQDFRLFSFSVAENIAGTADYDEEKIWNCLETAGLKERVANMPNGLKTVIYKDFDKDGVEISGGEAQKLAIARALYKDAPFVILDEPTAALDPIAEYEIYSRFNEMVKNKTAVYISHRLSSCRFCDKIAVFHQGEIIQFGSHDNLLADPNGKYHELWNAQAKYYDKKKAEQCS